MSDEAVLYWCDPEKNTACRKNMCRHTLRLIEGGSCEATFHPEFALRDENGQPMIYEKHEEWKRKKSAALAALKEREEKKKNVSGTDSDINIHVRRSLPGKRPAAGHGPAAHRRRGAYDDEMHAGCGNDGI